MMNGKSIRSKKSSIQPAAIEEIIEIIKYLRRRMLLHDSWNYTQSTMWIAAGAILLLLILSRLWPIQKLSQLSIAIVIFWVISIIIFSILIPRKDSAVAWRTDQDLKLKERLSSFINFLGKSNNQEQRINDFIVRQREDTLASLKSTPYKSVFKIKFSPRYTIRVILITIAASFLIILPNPMDAIIKHQEIIASAAEQEAEKIEQLIEGLKEDDQLSPEEKEALIQQLEKLAEKLQQNEGDLSEALAEISKFEQGILDRLDPELSFKQTAINSITDQLSELAKIDKNGSANETDLEEIMASIANQIADMDQAGLKSLSQTLQRMAAQAAQAGQSDLAEALASLSQSVLTSDLENTIQNAEQVDQLLGEAQKQLAGQQAFDKILGQLQESRMSLSQSGALSTASQNSNQGSQTGNGQNPGQGQNPGSGQGQNQGIAAGSGGGTKANALPGFTGSGTANNPTGVGQGNPGGNLQDQVYVPWERFDIINDSLSISGQDSGQGQTEVREQNLPLPGTNSPLLIPYREVYESYRDTAYETIQNSYIPSGLKDYVLRYFSLLEP